MPAEPERCQSGARRPGVVMLPRWSGAGAVPVVPGWRLVGDGVVLEWSWFALLDLQWCQDVATRLSYFTGVVSERC